MKLLTLWNFRALMYSVIYALKVWLQGVVHVHYVGNLFHLVILIIQVLLIVMLYIQDF